MTEETHGIWTTERYALGITTNMKKYKLDDFVTSIPLFSAFNSTKEKPSLTHDSGFGCSIEKLGDLFDEIKIFILKWPEYTVVLQTEIEGYGDIENYSNKTCKLGELTNIFDDIEVIADIRTTWNNIRMLWCLKEIHENIKPIWHFDNIIDFGAGTGHFIKHCYQVGFTGSVQVVDLPQTVELQKYILRGLNIKWVSAEELETNLPNTLFNSTWGISESPLSTRDKIPDLSRCSKFITFQHEYYDIDNKKDILRRFLEKGNTTTKDISDLIPWDGGSTMLMNKSFI